MIGYVRELARDLAGVDFGPQRWNASADQAFVEHARRTGAQQAERVLARWSERATGRELLRGLEQRTYSSTGHPGGGHP
jgi:hypothetical protein